MLTGENGIVTQAQEAKDNNERGKVIDDVKLAYNAVTIDKLGVQDISTMRDLTIIELKKQGYEIKDVTTTTETITEINLSIDELTLNAGGEEEILTIEYQEENASNSKYYIKIGTKYYELTINPGNIELEEEETDVENLETEVKDNIEITSSDTAETIIKIETVGNTITVTPVGEGTATITITNGSITKQCAVTVDVAKPTSISIKGKNSVEVTDTITLTAEFDKGEGNIQWTSSNPEVATVDSNGVVTGVCSTKGITTITAAYVEDTSIVDTLEITVNAKLIGECDTCDKTGMVSGYICPSCNSTRQLIDSEEIRYFCTYCGLSYTESDYYNIIFCPMCSMGATIEDFTHHLDCDCETYAAYDGEEIMFWHFGDGRIEYSIENSQGECPDCSGEGYLYNTGE